MIDFDDAPRAFSKLLIEYLGEETACEGRILRDIYGRLSFITPRPRDARFDKLQLAATQMLGAYGEPKTQLIVSLSDDEPGFRDLLAETSIDVSVSGQPKLRLIDRRLAGDDWLMRPSQLASNPSRLLFYSVKGGVGRSTALAVSAADLAAQGFNVLVLDLDLEAPGLGALLLPPEDMPKYGVTDWFAAVAAGADAESLIPDMTGPSPFTSAQAVVDVVPAAGRDPGAYLSKLARAYTPGSAGEQHVGFSFPRKADALVAQLTARRRYDAVLIDARAGLHETSGGLILGVGAKALFFGIDTSQTFEDFRLLFDAFAQAFDPAIQGEDLRSAFKMVHGKAPRDEKNRRFFREQSWEIWSDYLYDDVDPAAELSGDVFVFDLTDESAPHYPLEIIGDEAYARFDPRTETYPLSADAYRLVFGNFLAGVRVILGL
jgi:Mrp family chromosome partitioning ATPase